MRVLIYGFSGRILGGIETFVLNMNEHMSRDCVFDYMIDGGQCIYQDRIAENGGTIFSLTPIRRNPLAYIRDIWRTLGYCRKDGTRLLYVQLFSMANLLPAWLAKLRGYTVVLHAHNSGLQSKSRMYRVLHLIGRSISSSGNYVRLTNSGLSREFMFGKRVKAEVIYNAIDVDRFHFDPETRLEVRNNVNTGCKPVVGFIGRLAPPKNPLFMLGVFAEILKQQPDAMLWIIGEGELKDEMEQEAIRLEITKSIIWLGQRNDVGQLMQGMDVLLQPSIFEGLGIVFVEAQAAGLPCLTSADVVPKEAKVTDLLQFIPLGVNPREWAEAATAAMQSQVDRVAENSVIKEGHYNIFEEAKRLEKILLMCRNE